MKKSTINFSADKVPRLVASLTNMLGSTLPNSVYGMLSTAKETDQGLLVGDRWILQPVAAAHYNIVDKLTGQEIFTEISRLQTAVTMIYLLSKNPNSYLTKLKTLQAVDQTYYRCLTDIALFRQQIDATGNTDKRTTLQFRLEDKLYKLAEIKQQLFKLYC